LFIVLGELVDCCVGGRVSKYCSYSLTLQIVVCLVCFQGLYCDHASGIVEGACRPILIHADKTKTKEKEAQEHVRQRNGEAPTERSIATRWTRELEHLPDVAVETMGSGSMTQEVFAYTQNILYHAYRQTTDP